MNFERVASSVIRVGARARVCDRSQGNKLVLTAAHCLLVFPPCHGASLGEERTYANLLGRIGEDARVWAECLFADPIADVAILGPVDNQALPDRWDAYIDWLGEIDGLPIGDAHILPRGFAIA
jgi:hypothetical protein